MAVGASIWSSYGVGVPATGTEGNREDLLDLVTNLDKEKIAATFLALPKTTTNSLTHEWLLDTLAATNTAGASEGTDWSASALTGRTRMGNAVQSFRRDFGVSFDQVKLSQNGITAGVPNEYEYQVGKKLMEVTQSMDARIVANGSTVASNVGASATNGADRLMATLRAFQSSTPACVTADESGAWELATLTTMQETMFGAGARPNTLVCSHGVKLDITNALLAAPASSLVRYTQPSSGVYDQAVEYIRTDFGRVAVLVDIFVPQAAATNSAAASSAAWFLFDSSKIRLAFFRPLRHYPLPPNGDSFRGYVHGSATLEVLHPSCLGVAIQVTT